MNTQLTQNKELLYSSITKQDKQDINKKPSVNELLQPEINTETNELLPKTFQNLADQKQFLELPSDIDKEKKSFIHQILEDEKKLSLESIDGVVQRTSRQERVVEIHKCGCGQTYKSHSALFTHIRNKHNKIKPEGTTKQTQNSCKRGRPKKPIENIREDEKNNNKEVNLEKQLHGILNLDEKKIKNIAHFETQLEKEDIQTFLNTLKNNYDGYCNPFEGLPVFRNCSNLCIQQHPFINLMIEMKEGKNFENNKITKESSCDLIFSVFLLNVANFVNLKLYRLINLTIRLYRNFVNKELYSILDGQQINSLKKNKIKENKVYEFTEIEDSSFLPIVGNDFISSYLPVHCPELDQTFCAYLIQDFLKWLAKKKFTTIKTEIFETTVDHDDYQQE